MGSITRITVAIMTWLEHINDPKRMSDFPIAAKPAVCRQRLRNLLVPGTDL
jgi:hypothetical protein